MTHVSEQYIRDLEPESLRYDVTLDDDFVISVLPNGIKTWAFLYDYKGRQRRKTLGIYPEMSHAQANMALGNARSMLSRLGDGIDTIAQAEPSSATVAQSSANDLIAARPAVLASGYRRRGDYRGAQSRKPSRWPKYLLFAVAGLVVAGLGYLALTKLGTGDAASTTVPTTNNDAPTTRKTPTIRKTPTTPTTPAKNPFGTRSATPRPDPSDETAPDTDRAPSGNEREQDQPNGVGGEEAQDQDDVPTSDSGAGNESGALPGAAPNSPVVAAATGDAQVSAPRSLDAGQTAADREAPATKAAQTTPAMSDAPAQSAREPPAVASTQPARVTAVPQAATSRGGSVTRAVVTSGIDDLEPVDDVGDRIALNDNGFRSVFFFTELRNFSDGNVIHRWELNGSVLADVPLRVARSWRWRTYSSKDLLPGMMGDWSVSVIDANGDVLASRSFTFDNE